MTRKMLTVLVASMSTLAFAGTASAGNWATTRIDEAPKEFAAGETHEVVYTVLQHGRTPVEGASTALVFEPAKATPSLVAEVVFKGFPTDEPGQYRAEVELPVGGVWILEVRQGPFGSARVGSVEVSAGGVASVVGGDVFQFAFMVIGGVLLALYISRTRIETELRTRIEDHVADVGAERA